MPLRRKMQTKVPTTVNAKLTRFPGKCISRPALDLEPLWFFHEFIIIQYCRWSTIGKGASQLQLFFHPTGRRRLFASRTRIACPSKRPISCSRTASHILVPHVETSKTSKKFSRPCFQTSHHQYCRCQSQAIHTIISVGTVEPVKVETNRRSWNAESLPRMRRHIRFLTNTITPRHTCAGPVFGAVLTVRTVMLVSDTTINFPMDVCSMMQRGPPQPSSIPTTTGHYCGRLVRVHGRRQAIPAHEHGLSTTGFYTCISSGFFRGTCIIAPGDRVHMSSFHTRICHNRSIFSDRKWTCRGLRRGYLILSQARNFHQSSSWL